MARKSNPRKRAAKPRKPASKPRRQSQSSTAEEPNEAREAHGRLLVEVTARIRSELPYVQDADIEDAVSDAFADAFASKEFDATSPDASDRLFENAKQLAKKLHRERHGAQVSLDKIDLEDHEPAGGPEPDVPVYASSAMSPMERDTQEFKKTLSATDRLIFDAPGGERYSKKLTDETGFTSQQIRNRKYKLKELHQKFLKEKGHDVSGAPRGPGSLADLIVRISQAIVKALPAEVRHRGLSIDEARKLVESLERKSSTWRQAPKLEPERRLERPKYLSTGFDALDKLLGGQGFIQGSSILIRGQPGTGKTTLALQIAKHAIGEGHKFVYASVEGEPAVLLDQVTQSFWHQSYEQYLGDESNWHVEDLTRHFDDVVRPQAAHDALQQVVHDANLDESDRAALADRPEIEEALSKHDALADPVNTLVDQQMHRREIDQLLEQLWEKLPVQEAPVVLVVDSLNSLINSATMRFHGGPDRTAMLAVLNSFRRWRSRRSGNVTVIFLVEPNERIEQAAASFLADVVVDLGWRDVEQTIYETQEKPSKWVQEIRFCRVRKGRGLPIQNRACAYEFAYDKDADENNGIVFLPTYAAQGVVSLFYENPAMEEVITTLREHDVPALFPQVLVQPFSQAALQRVFSLSRRRTSISLRHPMMLSNIDEYWLKRLQYYKLIHPIPVKKLRICTLPLEDTSEVIEDNPFIEELTKKDIMFADDGPNGEKMCGGVPQIANVGMLVYRKDLLDLKEIKKKPPKTWEEVEEICSLLKEKGKPHKLRLELESYDTFLATALELGWAHGAVYKTVPAGKDKLRIEFEPGSDVNHLIAALVRLKHWIFSLQIVPKGSTVDSAADAEQDWVFARHWYSTWIDVAMRKEVKDARREGAEYGVLPIPLDAGHNERSGGKAQHHSAWGEWYLAILRGSENIELGIDLINNLMTARKITERARSGAALPTAERFYALTDEDCPETGRTFKEVRKMFFANARSRSDFEDYPQFARIFSFVLRTVTTNRRANIIETVRNGLLAIDPKFKWPKNVEQRLKEILSPQLAKSVGPL